MQTKKIVLILGVIFLVAGCTQPDQVQPNLNNINTGENQDLVENEPNINVENEGVDGVPIVEQGDIVKIEYVGTFPDTGEEFDKSAGRGPLEFVAGAGQMIAGFDKAVMGMKLNDEKTVEIPPEDAYGKAGSGPVLTATVDQLPPDSKAGDSFTASNGQQVTVITIDGNNATVRVAHELEGKTLKFWIKVVEIQKK